MLGEVRIVIVCVYDANPSKTKKYQVTIELVKMSTLYAGYKVEENSHFFPSW